MLRNKPPKDGFERFQSASETKYSQFINPRLFFTPQDGQSIGPMEGVKNRRQRKKSQTQNVVAEPRDEKEQESGFSHRQSPLTVLIQSSLHIRAMYHIFVVILLMLFLDTVIYDLVERGQINIATSTVAYGFGDIGRGVKLWLFELAVALAFYPGLRLYTAGARLFRNNPGAEVEKCFLSGPKYLGLSRLWKTLAVSGLVGLQGALVVVPVWALGRKHLAIASAVTVTCEMFRFAMKIHAVTIACASRWREDSTPLPTFKHYLYFLFAPTLIYRDQYPRTEKIRWGAVIFNFVEVAAIIFYNSFLWERFILPYWSNYGKESKVEAGSVVRGMFACVLPGVISFLCGFYCLLHAWLNAFAEMLKFGDRLFYEEWWTTSRFSTFYRAWNRVVHSWLRDHIHKPLAPYTGRALAYFLVFFVSAAAHEVILALSFGFFYPVLMMQFGVLGVLLVPLTASSGRRFPSVMNLLMWKSFFVGNGILWSLYPMEYFARKNCPPADTDSFFVPKSWTCPEIVLKPNWTFHNPFQINY